MMTEIKGQKHCTSEPSLNTKGMRNEDTWMVIVVKDKQQRRLIKQCRGINTDLCPIRMMGGGLSPNFFFTTFCTSLKHRKKFNITCYFLLQPSSHAWGIIGLNGKNNISKFFSFICNKDNFFIGRFFDSCILSSYFICWSENVRTFISLICNRDNRFIGRFFYTCIKPSYFICWSVDNAYSSLVVVLPWPLISIATQRHLTQLTRFS